jgi:hypothetical protein
MTELRALIEDIKEHEMSMYNFFTDAEITEKKKRVSELWKNGRV